MFSFNYKIFKIVITDSISLCDPVDDTVYKTFRTVEDAIDYANATMSRLATYTPHELAKRIKLMRELG